MIWITLVNTHTHTHTHTRTHTQLSTGYKLYYQLSRLS